MIVYQLVCKGRRAVSGLDATVHSKNVFHARADAELHYAAFRERCTVRRSPKDHTVLDA